LNTTDYGIVKLLSSCQTQPSSYGLSTAKKL
jgi:hypothetical protein